MPACGLLGRALLAVLVFVLHGLPSTLAETTDCDRVERGEILATPQRPVQGGTVTLELQIQPHLARTIRKTIGFTWYHNRARLDVADARYNIAGQTLTVRNLRQQDGGTYTCFHYFWQATSAMSHKIKVVRGDTVLHVLIPGQTQELLPRVLSFQVSPNPAREGDAVVATCMTQDVIVSYFLVNNGFCYSSDRRFKEKRLAGILTLQGANMSDDGMNITCAAARVGPPVKQTIRLKVLPALDQSDLLKISLDLHRLELSWQHPLLPDEVDSHVVRMTGKNQSFINHLPGTQRSLSLGQEVPYVVYALLGATVDAEVKAELKNDKPALVSRKTFQMPSRTAPVNITSSQLSSTSMNVSWQVQHSQHHDFSLRSFTVTATAVSCSAALRSFIVPPNARQTVIDNLTPGCKYDVKVTAQTMADVPFSNISPGIPPTTTTSNPMTTPTIPISNRKRSTIFIIFSNAVPLSCRIVKEFRAMANQVAQELFSSCHLTPHDGTLRPGHLSHYCIHKQHVPPGRFYYHGSIFTNTTHTPVLESCIPKQRTIRSQHFTWVKACLTNERQQCIISAQFSTTHSSQTQATTNAQTRPSQNALHPSHNIRGTPSPVQPKFSSENDQNTSVLIWAFLAFICFVIVVLVCLLVIFVRNKFSPKPNPENKTVTGV